MRKILYTLPVLCCGFLLSLQLMAQSRTAVLMSPVGSQASYDTPVDFGDLLTADLHEDFTLLDDHTKPLDLPAKVGSAGNAVCGFCGSDDTDEEMLPGGNNKLIWDGNIEVYPVPASGSFFIRGGQYLLNASLYSMDGRLIRTISPTAAEISAEDLAPGIYLLRMDTGADLITRRLVIQ